MNMVITLIKGTANSVTANGSRLRKKKARLLRSSISFFCFCYCSRLLPAFNSCQQLDAVCLQRPSATPSLRRPTYINNKKNM